MNRLLSTLAFGALLGAATAYAAEPIPYFNPCSDLSTVTAIGNTNGTTTQNWTVTAPSYSDPNTAFRVYRAATGASVYTNGWIFTPELDVDPSKIYKISLDMWVQSTGNATTTREGYVYTCSDASADASKTLAMECKLLNTFLNGNTNGNLNKSAYVSFKEGEKYVGIAPHCAGTYNYFWIDNIRVEEISPLKPAASSNIEVKNITTQDNPWNKDVKLTFNAPSTNVLGAELSSLSSVKVWRDGAFVKEFTNITPGQQLELNETVSTLGVVTYTLTAYNQGVEGDSATGSATVGAMNLTPTLYGSSYNCDAWDYNPYVQVEYVAGQGVKVFWRPFNDGPKDADGNPYPVTYKVYTMMEYAIPANGQAPVPVADGVTSCEWLDTSLRPGLSQLYTYVVEPYYDNGGEQPVKAATWISATASLNNPVPFKTTISNEALWEFTDHSFEAYGGYWYRWKYYDTVTAAQHGGVKKTWQVESNNNWLISPGIALEAGKTYRIDLDIFCNTNLPGNIDFKLCHGLSNTVDAMTDELIERTTFLNPLPKNYYAFYTPEADEMAFFGVWATNPNAATQKTYDPLAISRWDVYEVSPNLPGALENVTVTYSKDDSSKAFLNFIASSKNIAGKALNALTKIEIFKNGTLFKTLDNPVPGQKYSIDIDIEIGKEDTYTFYPYSAEGLGLESSVNVTMFEAPYSNAFPNKGSLTGWTIINSDLSGYSWGFQSEAVRCFTGGEAYDDYLISPPIHLEGNYWYKADMTTWLDRENSYSESYVELLVGTSPDVASMTKVAIPAYNVKGSFGSKALIKDYFRIDESGDYYIAIHATTPQNGDNIYVDDLNISAKIDPTVPAPVQNFTVTPDPEGAYSMTVSYDLPTVDLDGNPLGYLPSKVEFYFDEFPTNSMNVYYPKATEADENGVIHKEFTFTHGKLSDLGPKDYLFWVIPFKNNNEKGKEAELKAFIGINKPAAIETFEVEEYADEYGKVHFKWDAPTMDKDGYKLNTTALTYDVCRYETWYEETMGGSIIQREKITKYAEDITETECDAIVKENADKQEFCRFFIDAKTSAGTAAPHYVSKWIAVGKPYEMPLYESFANMKFEYFTMSQTTHGYSQWGSNTMNPVTGVEPVDGDRGLAMMEVAWADAGSRLYTARVNVTGEQPIFTMYVYNQTKPGLEDNNEITVEVRESNMGEFEAVESHTVKEWAQGRQGWQKAQVDLSDYIGKTIYLSLDGFAHNCVFTHVDALSLMEKPEVDLGLHTIAHSSVYVGAPHAITVNVKNYGKTASGEYTAKLLLDGEEVASKTCESLEAGAEGQIAFDHLLTRTHLGYHNYSIKVEAEGDADLVDNTIVAAEFELRDNEYPQVENLAAAQNEEGMELTWEAPVFSTDIVEVTEDFENYVEWTTIHTGGLGDWTLLDLDGGPVGGFYNYEMPNVEYGSTQSFFLMDTSDSFFSQDTRYRAHSGDLCLVSSYNVDRSYTEDAIISPLLPGTAQTVKFWAKGLTDTKEYVHFLYSTTDTNLESFTEMEGQYVGPEWTELSYDLPEGALYFMIVHENINGGYYFFLDDITYTPLGYGNLVLNGYHVYVEGDKMTADGHITDLAYTHATSEEASKRYGVSALYNLGESYAKEINASWSGTDIIKVGTPIVKAQDMAIVVSNARGKDVIITNATGMVLASFTASATNRVPMPAVGVYMVTIDNQTTKVVVK